MGPTECQFAIVLKHGKIGIFEFQKKRSLGYGVTNQKYVSHGRLAKSAAQIAKLASLQMARLSAGSFLTSP